MAKKFSSVEAAAFINGILDALLRSMAKSSPEKGREEKVAPSK
jgi:hypothetical protein